MKTKKILSVLLAILMAFSVMSVGFMAFAGSDTIDDVVIKRPKKWYAGLSDDIANFTTDSSKYKVSDVSFFKDEVYTLDKQVDNGKITLEKAKEIAAQIFAEKKPLFSAIDELNDEWVCDILMVISPSDGCKFKCDEYGRYTGEITIPGAIDQDLLGNREPSEVNLYEVGAVMVSEEALEEYKEFYEELFGVEIDASVGDMIVTINLGDIEEEPSGFQLFLVKFEMFFEKIGYVFKKLFKK